MSMGAWYKSNILRKSEAFEQNIVSTRANKIFKNRIDTNLFLVIVTECLHKQR